MSCSIFGLFLAAVGAGLLWFCANDASCEKLTALHYVFGALVAVGVVWAVICATADAACSKTWQLIKYLVTCRCVRRN